MKAKLTFWERVNLFFGYGYVVNIGTGEIHRLKNKLTSCRIEMITKKIYVSKKIALQLFQKGFNGCSKCFKTEDNG